MGLLDPKIKTLGNIVQFGSVTGGWTLINDFAGSIRALHIQSSLNQNFVLGFSTQPLVEPVEQSIAVLLGSATNVRDFVLDFAANGRIVSGYIWIMHLGVAPSAGQLSINFITQ